MGLREEIDRERRLEHIDLEITKKCNLFCVHCSAESNSIGKELSTTESKTILDSGILLGLENVGFTGGEPLTCRSKLVSLLEYCRHDLDLKTHVHTNGTLLKSDDAEVISNLTDEITVTFYGSDPKSHDGITSVKGSLKAAEMGLSRLVKKHSNVRAFIVPMKSNFREIPRIVSKIHEIGCDKIRILSLSPTGRARRNFEKLSPDAADRKWLNTKLTETRKQLDVVIDAGFCTRQYYPQLGQLKGHPSCLAAENRVHIDAFGEVFPCTASSGWQEFSAGNLRRNGFDLSKIWKFSPIFQFIRFFHVNPPNKCHRCTIYQQCMGGCRVMMYYKHKDITVAKPKCEYAR